MSRTPGERTWPELLTASDKNYVLPRILSLSLRVSDVGGIELVENDRSFQADHASMLCADVALILATGLGLLSSLINGGKCVTLRIEGVGPVASHELYSLFSGLIGDFDMGLPHRLMEVKVADRFSASGARPPERRDAGFFLPPVPGDDVERDIYTREVDCAAERLPADSLDSSASERLGAFRRLWCELDGERHLSEFMNLLVPIESEMSELPAALARGYRQTLLSYTYRVWLADGANRNAEALRSALEYALLYAEQSYQHSLDMISRDPGSSSK